MPKSISERVVALRERAAALGLKRLELYAHPEDWVAIKELAAKLQKRREKAAKAAANASFSREPERSGGESAGSDSYGGTDD